jgi:hypothetical protein
LRPAEEQTLHEKVVTEISRKVFAYPDERRPDLFTVVNHPKVNAQVKSPGGEIAPDIVVLNTRSKFAVAIAHVETPSTVTEQESEQWKQLSMACNNLFIYVPEEKAADAQKLLTAKEVAYSALVGYRLAERGKLTVKQIAAHQGNIYGKPRK